MSTYPAQGIGGSVDSFFDNEYWRLPDEVFSDNPDHPELKRLRTYHPDVAARWDQSSGS